MEDTVRRIVTRDGSADGVEAVETDDLSTGDRVLVYADERVPADGVLVDPPDREALPSPDAEPILASKTDAPPAEIAVESRDGEHRRAVLGERVRADETVRDGSVVVEVGPRRVVPWVPVSVGTLTSLLRWNGQSLVRLALVVLVVGIALTGTGLGANNPLSDFARDNSDQISEVVNADGRINNQGVTPEAPPVEATPPEPSTPNGTDTPTSPSGASETETTATPSATPAEPPTETDASTTTATATATATNGGQNAGGNNAGTGGTTASATLNLSAGDPGEVQNDDGVVENVSGPVSGSLTWTGSVDSVVVVVQSWVPEQGWQEIRRVTVTGSSPVSLGELLGDTVYANGSRAAAFNNGQNGTTQRITGYLSVTAVLFEGENEVARAEATDSFNATVTNVGSGSPPLELELGDGAGKVDVIDFGNGSDAGSDSGVVVPGSNGVNTVTLANNGSRDGVLELASVSYTSYENGLTGPESEVDNTGGDPGAGAGELHEALEIRAALEFENGSSRYVIGNGTDYRTIASLTNTTKRFTELAAGDSVDLVVEFRVPQSAGNEIQSDTVVVDFAFRLVNSSESSSRVTAGTVGG